jgi:hypothetical protein
MSGLYLQVEGPKKITVDPLDGSWDLIGDPALDQPTSANECMHGNSVFPFSLRRA